jgi:hypothetical protein
VTLFISANGVASSSSLPPSVSSFSTTRRPRSRRYRCHSYRDEERSPI